MKFIVDAQLPKRLSTWLCENEHDCLHTLDLPSKNRTKDCDIAELADESGRVVISKDIDFITLKILTGKPNKLLSIGVGNISNKDLLDLFDANLVTIEKLFESFEMVEMTRTLVIGRNLD